jgi:hypothetical protein
VFAREPPPVRSPPHPLLPPRPRTAHPSRHDSRVHLPSRRHCRRSSQALLAYLPSPLTRVSCQATPDRPSLRDNASNALPAPQPRRRLTVSAALAAAVVTAMPAYADLNKYEAEQRGEFGIGSAAQYGSAHLKYALSLVHSPCSSYCIGFFYFILTSDACCFVGRLSMLTRTSGEFLISPVQVTFFSCQVFL